jgi:hypothetical protein
MNLRRTSINVGDREEKAVPAPLEVPGVYLFNDMKDIS